MKTKIILTTLLCIAVLAGVRAQSAIEDLNFEMVLIPENDPYAALDPDSFPLPRHAPTALVDLSNTEDIARIHTRIGTSSGIADIAEHILDFETQGVLEDGAIYALEGNRATIIYGSYYHQGSYYIQVRLERPDGSFTDWQEISAN
jgi:hypothetical protein